MTYDPQKHHRRSIRMKGHDYAGGGAYFVTMCAHRDWIAQCHGQPFHQPSVRESIGEVWELLPSRFAGVSVGAGFMSAQKGFMPAQKGFMPAPKGAHEGCPERGAHEGCPERGARKGVPMKGARTW